MHGEPQSQTFPPFCFSSWKDTVFKLLLRSELFWQVMEGIARIARYYLLSPRSLWDQWSRHISTGRYRARRHTGPAWRCASVSLFLYGSVQVFTSVRSYPPCYSVTQPVPPNRFTSLLCFLFLTFWTLNKIPFCTRCVFDWNKSPIRIAAGTTGINC